MNNDYIMELRDVRKSYRDFALDNVNIALPCGAIMGFIGENGAGKSTTIKAILNLIRRDGGEIRLFGLDNLADEREIKQRIGVVFDEASFPPQARQGDVDRIMGHIYRDWQPQDFARWCHKLRLTPDKMVKDYSRGMKMKLAIAVALSHQARLLILDEPTSGLDPLVRDEILDVFLDFIQDERHSIFVSSHLISDLEKAADYITLLHEGRILFSETKDTLKEQYALLKCGRREYEVLDKRAVVGDRISEFGVEALVRPALLPRGTVTEPAGLEDIMIYHVRGVKA